MNQRHEARYKRAMARLSLERVTATTDKVDAALLKTKNKQLPEGFRENYIAHKLGQRRVKP